ncbi:hypothetical protein IJT10_02205, partial [bacterium]|nr:hypothetical protein [bacterium]
GQRLKAYDGKFSALESLKIQDKWIKANTMWDDVANYIDPQKAFQLEPESAEPPKKVSEQSKTDTQPGQSKTVNKENKKNNQRKKK